MQSVMHGAKTFAPLKAASAVITFYQKVDLFDHKPTQSQAMCLVRGAATTKFGLNSKNRNRASALHVCSFAYLPIVVLLLVSCGARVPANGLGAVLISSSFLGCGRE